MKTKKVPTPVKLRQKKLRNGDISLYLDTYANGKRTYEFLNLYLRSGYEHKEENQKTLILATEICERRNDTARRTIANGNNSKYQQRLLDFIATLHFKFRQIMQFIDEDTLVSDLCAETDRKVLERITKANLRPSSKAVYYRMYITVKNKAVNLGLAQWYKSPTAPRMIVPERNFLTVDELRTIAQTDLSQDQRLSEYRRAFLFSCLTGLRKCDIMKLTWSEVSQVGNFTRLTFTQKKVGRVEYTDISNEAVRYLGNRGQDYEKVFPEINNTNLCYNNACRLMRKCGIQKYITFHCARHTFAVMMLDLGADIYTVSKLLGHSDISITQIYAKVLDKNKRAAVALIPKIE